MESEPCHNLLRIYTLFNWFLPATHFFISAEFTHTGASVHVTFHSTIWTTRRVTVWRRKVPLCEQVRQKVTTLVYFKSPRHEANEKSKNRTSLPIKQRSGLKESFQSYLEKVFHGQTRGTSLRPAGDAAAQIGQMRSPEWLTAGTCKTWHP